MKAKKKRDLGYGDAVFFRFPMPHGEITACAQFQEKLIDYPDGERAVSPGWQIGLAFCSMEDYGMSRKARRQIGRNLAFKKRNLVVRCSPDVRAGLLRVKVIERIVFGPRHLGVFHYSGADEKCRFKQFVDKTIPFLAKQLESYPASTPRDWCGPSYRLPMR